MLLPLLIVLPLLLPQVPAQTPPQDLGPISLGKFAVAQFALPSQALDLTRVEASCACQKIELLLPGKKARILPHRGVLQITLPFGHQGRLRVFVPVTQEGKKRESLRLWCKGQRAPFSFPFQFEGVSPFSLSQKRVAFGEVLLGKQAAVIRVRVKRRDGQAFSLLPPRNLPKGFAVQVMPLGARFDKDKRPQGPGLKARTSSLSSSAALLSISLNTTDLPPGPAGGNLEFKSVGGETFHLWLSAKVKDPVTLLPLGPLVFGLVPRGRREIAKRLVLDPGGWLRKVRLVGLPKKAFVVRWKKLGNKRVLIEVLLSPKRQAGSFRGKLVLLGEDGSRRERVVVGKVLN